MSEPIEMNAATDRVALYTPTQGLCGKRVIVEEADALIDQVAQEMSDFARQRVMRAGVFHLALSGGSTPQALYRRLMIDPRYRLFPWAKTHLWIVDDRCVPADDDRYNSNMVRGLIADHADLPNNNFHPMPVLEADGDRAYEHELRELLAEEGVNDRLDYTLLGMGGDGHTASLFPQTPGLEESDRWVVLNDGELVAEPRPRMTMTYPLINSSRMITLLVTGAGKHAMLRKVADATRSGGDARNPPIAGIAPTHDDAEMIWYLDKAAAIGQ